MTIKGYFGLEPNQMSKEPETAEQIKFPSWIKKPPPQIEKLLTDMPDEVYRTIVKEILSLAKPFYREQIRQQVIEEIDPFMHLLIPRLRTKADINQYAEWWQQFKEGK